MTISQKKAEPFRVTGEGKTQTRKAWFAMRPDGHTTHHTYEEARCANYPGRGPIIAIVEREITFTHGEGLGQELPS